MFKKVTLALAVTGLMAGTAFGATSAASGINGSKHDMNVFGGATDAYGRTCVFCHTPHNAAKPSNGPLWNRAENTVAIAPYQWKATLNTVGLAITDATAGPTRLCLSCHDGNVAVDSHGSNSPLIGGAKLSGATKISDMTVTHPIGFDYNAAATRRTSTEIVPSSAEFLATATASFDTHSRGTNGTGRTIAGTLYQGLMTCATCHEVHNTNNAKPDSGHTYNFFLNAKQEGSAICLSCHVK